MLSQQTNSDSLRRKALSFVILISLTSLFSDMTHAGAKSIYGAFLSYLGASAAAIGFISGLAQFAARGLSLVSGYLADKWKNYWTLVIVGYLLCLVSIPALALVSGKGWMIAGALIVIERVGKACWQPSRNTLVSFTSSRIGSGKSFSIMGFFNKMGACIGPLFLFLILLFKHHDLLIDRYHLCFLILGIPALITLFLILIARRKYTHPEDFEKPGQTSLPKSQLSAIYILFCMGMAFFGLGFFDFPLITLHLTHQPAINTEFLPLFFSAAMLVAALSALLFGRLFDRIGVYTLVISTLISAPFAFFIFIGDQLWMMCVGILIWGVGIGSIETVFKSVVARLVTKENRSRGYGIVNVFLGLALFVGSWLCGIFYNVSFTILILFSVATQLLAVLAFLICHHKMRKAGY